MKLVEDKELYTWTQAYMSQTGSDPLLDDDEEAFYAGAALDELYGGLQVVQKV